MAAQKTNSAIIFVAVLVAAAIVVYAVVNRPGPGPAGPGAADDAPPVVSPPVLEQGGSDPDAVTHIDQTTDTTLPPPEAAADPGDALAEPAVVPNLLDAAERGDTEALAALIESGADLDQRDAGGRTALMAAAGGGQIDAVFVLLNAGADAALRDNARRAARDYALARYDEPGKTIARILEDAIGVVPIQDPTDK